MCIVDASTSSVCPCNLGLDPGHAELTSALYCPRSSIGPSLVMVHICVITQAFSCRDDMSDILQLASRSCLILLFNIIIIYNRHKPSRCMRNSVLHTTAGETAEILEGRAIR